jgi:hypothetical protein
VIEGKMAGRIEVTGRRGRRREGYWILKYEELSRTLWRTRFGRDMDLSQDRLWNDDAVIHWYLKLQSKPSVPIFKDLEVRLG